MSHTRALAAVGVLAAALLTPALLQARDLTFEDRVKAQEAIERVYYSHQIGTTKTFEEAVPRTLLEKKVRTYLKQSVALENVWHTPVTAAALRAETERIAQGTRFPDRLREIYSALGRDSFLIEECFARPFLVDRLTRNFFAFDGRIHDRRRQEAEGLRQSLQSGALSAFSEHPARRVVEARLAGQVGDMGQVVEEREAFVIRVVVDDSDDHARTAVYTIPKTAWDDWWAATEVHLDERLAWSHAAGFGDLPQPAGQQAAPDAREPGTLASSCLPDDRWDNGILDVPGLPDGRELHTAVWTGSLMIVWGGSGGPTGSALNTGGRYDPVTDTWTPTSTLNAPQARYSHSAVWTGSLMLVWGGRGNLDTGGRYDPVSDTWTPTSTSGAPEGRFRPSVVWTGSQMIVWGGETAPFSQYVNTGGRYDPVSDTWSPTSTIGAPSPRYWHAAAWTGRLMVVWGGGTNSSVSFPQTGGRYDPVTDTWTPTSTIGAPDGRIGPTAVWTGSRVIFWGGAVGCCTFNDGGQYDPASDSWTPTSTTGAPRGRYEHGAVWTGSVMIVWGGESGPPWNDGGRYDPVSDTWTPTSTTGAPAATYWPSVVWTGSLMIVWGGNQLDAGGRYDPVSDIWTPTSATRPLLPSWSAPAVWTGNLMIVWAGSAGARYDPVGDAWTYTSTIGAPGFAETAVWTGNLMIVWSGIGLGGGGRYDPVGDTWSPISTTNAPPARYFHTAVWTGSAMIVWGGRASFNQYLNTGWRYDPVADSWAPISTLGAPTARANHTAVWTGSVMIVWGGRTTAPLDTGGRYDPASDTWTPIATLGAPSGRYYHSAVWSGGRMIVWGGRATRPLETGGLYDPAGDAWTPTTTVGAPPARDGHSAIWTGRVMIVWGGGSPTPFNTGGQYDPAGDTWTPTTTIGAPSARAYHTAVWTGSFMIVWGGYGRAYLNTGGRYDPGQNQVDNDGDSVSECAGDCDDADPAVHPGAMERCNGLDDSCDGLVDEGFDVGLGCTAPVDECRQVVGRMACLPDGTGTRCDGPVSPHDVTPPLIICPADVISECPIQPVPGPAVATDSCDPAPRIAGDAPALFRLGTTVVTFTATDASGNASACMSSATMSDTLPPALTLPSGFTVDATTPSGALLNYAALATDACAGALAPACDPPSGSTFPINPPGRFTTVACEAADPSGNGAAGSFPMHVKGAEEQLGDLDRLVLASRLPPGLANDLENKIREALRAISAGKTREACHKMEEFAKKVREESRKKKPRIPAGQAAGFLDAAARIRAVLGCG